MSVLCITSTVAGSVFQTVATVADCALLGADSFVVQLASDVVTKPTLQDIFAIPLASDLQQMFAVGFGLPICSYVTAWSLGILINMFKSRY